MSVIEVGKPIVRVGSFVPRLTLETPTLLLAFQAETLLANPANLLHKPVPARAKTCPTLVLVHPLPRTIDGIKVQIQELGSDKHLSLGPVWKRPAYSRKARKNGSQPL